MRFLIKGVAVGFVYGISVFVTENYRYVNGRFGIVVDFYD